MKKQKERGFTLIELLIAVFILSVVLLAVSSMVYSVMGATSTSKETSTATTLMQDQMERLKNSPLSSLTSGSDNPAVPGNITYSRRWCVCAPSDLSDSCDSCAPLSSPPENIRKIKVTVNWTNRGSHSVAMTSLRGE